MDLITSSLLKDFSTEFEVNELDEDDQFEHFVAYVAVRRHYSETFETSDIVVGNGNDLAIDSVATIVNGILVTSVDAFSELMSGNPDYLDVTFIFIQAKRSPKFEAAQIASFGYGVGQFFDPDTKEPRNDDILAAVDLMKAIFENSAKFKRGNPACMLYYATTGKWNDEPHLTTRLAKVKADLEALEYFSTVEASPMGASDVQKFYNQTKNSISREFVFANRQDIPEISGVKEAFLGFIPANLFLPIISEGNEVIRSIFYDNVRDFQGYNEVNGEMQQTIKSDRKGRFVLMNNGITIIARNMTHTGSKFIIEDFQIVNGCQTSHVLFYNLLDLDDSVMVPLKLIWTQDEDVIQDIIHATNKQTEISSDQFFAISEFARQLESYFQAFPDNRKLYYERRSRQYDRLSIEKTRIVVQTNAIRAFAAMFLNEPHNTVRSYRTLAERVGKDIFIPGHKLLPYYTASYALYLLEYLFRNQKINPVYKLARFQILLAVRLLSNPASPPALISKQIEPYCQVICDELWDIEKMESLFARALEAIDAVSDKTIDRDQINTITFTDAVIQQCKSMTKNSAS